MMHGSTPLRSPMSFGSYPRLLAWWQDDPLDPDRPTLNNPDVRRLINAIDPHAQATDLGGVMSLNVRLQPADLVLRVHQPWVSRRRLLALQQVRQQLVKQGLIVPQAVRWQGTTMLACGKRWAELEHYLPHERLAPAWAAYAWLFHELGTLHRKLAALDLPVPRPLVATYASPATLRRWVAVTEGAVRDDPEAGRIVELICDLVRRLGTHWTPASQLPVHLIHGDVRLSNVCRTPAGTCVYFDFGFLARRPRVHDLAYAVAYMVRALDHHHEPQHFAWQRVPELIEAYESSADSHLTPAERSALLPCIAAVPIYHAAVAGFANDPVHQLQATLPFLRLSEWLLAHSANHLDMLGVRTM